MPNYIQINKVISLTNTDSKHRQKLASRINYL